MSNRLAVMRRGRIEQIGEPGEVYEHPQTEFVAGFLGASNLLDGRVEGRGAQDATVQVEGGSVIRVPVERLNGAAPEVRVGVRPEKIHLERDDGEPRPEWNVVRGLLRMATFVGVSHQYTVEGPGGRTLTVYAQNLGNDSAPHPGEQVRLMWRPEHTFVVAPDPHSNADAGEEEQ
jgi:spermidine/putrescine transport system ATP-binding protein